ncbi:hypothetical protein D3C80_1637480 [compost metagenome]
MHQVLDHADDAAGYIEESKIPHFSSCRAQPLIQLTTNVHQHLRCSEDHLLEIGTGHEGDLAL